MLLLNVQQSYMGSIPSYRGEGDMLVACCVMLNKSVPHVVVREGGSMVIKVSGKISGWVNEPVRCEGAK